jgi:hypothetical protein
MTMTVALDMTALHDLSLAVIHDLSKAPPPPDMTPPPRTIMFSGSDSNGKMLQDTWAYDGNNWISLIPANSPPGRMKAYMAFDSHRKVVVMFGGLIYVSPSMSVFKNDTWEFDGSTWTQVQTKTSPDPRLDGAMAFDSRRNVMVLYGGDGQSAATYDDTWEYDGTNWTKNTGASNIAPTRDGPAMAFDDGRGKMVLFGGDAGPNGAKPDTWEYDGGMWTQIAPTTSPAARYAASLIYDVRRGRVVLYGGAESGTDDVTDTWEYGGTNWVQISTSASPPPRSDATMVYDIARGKTVLFGGQITTTVSGGGTQTTYYQDTWEYDGSTWARNPTATIPAARYDATMAYFP